MPLFVISGCSGGGKTTILEELRKRGQTTVLEPGMRIIAEERAHSSDALPWKNPVAFAQRAVEMAKQDLAGLPSQPSSHPVFFDRGLVDAANALERATGETAPDAWNGQERYERTVFLTAPWPELFRENKDRRHSFGAAEEEYHSLLAAYARLGFDTVLIPQISVDARVDWLLAAVSDLA